MRSNRKFTHNLSDAEVRSIFLDAMKVEGLIFEAKDVPIIMDGKTRYVRVANRSRNKTHHRSGWYVGHLGDFPAGKFGWMHGEQSEFSWSLYKHLKNSGESITYVELTEEQIAANKLKEERELKRRIREDAERYNFSKALTIVEWVRSLPLQPHPYLTSKRFSIEECAGTARIYNRTDFTAKEVEKILKEHFPEYVKPSNIRKLINYQIEYIKYRGFNIIIKGETINNDPLMFQLLFSKKNRAGKNKYFPKLQVKHQTFCRLGPELTNDTTDIYICEGWATAISLLRITCYQFPIFVAWDSGNMKAVAIAIRKRFPRCRINCGIDNDHTKPLNKNAGIIGGLKICHAVGAYLIIPPFDSKNPLHEPLSDWNDIDLNYSPQETTQMFNEALAQSKFISAVFEENLALISDDQNLDFNDYPDELFLSANFNILWASMIPLIEYGLQHCQYSIAEQEEMFRISWDKTYLEFKSNEWDKNKRIFDANIDLKISSLFLVFTNNLMLSPKPITSNYDLFSPLLTQLLYMQDYLPNTNLLTLVFTAVSGLYGEELARACLPQYLTKTKYFRRSQDIWHKAVLNQIAQKVDVASLALIPPLLLTCREADYWEHLDKADREKAAAENIIRVSEEILKDFPLVEDQAENCMGQVVKLNHITNAINQYIISRNEQNERFLLRIVQRFNETESVEYPVQDISRIITIS